MAGSRLAQVYVGDNAAGYGDVAPGTKQGEGVLHSTLNLVVPVAGADCVTLPDGYPAGTPVIIRNWTPPEEAAPPPPPPEGGALAAKGKPLSKDEQRALAMGDAAKHGDEVKRGDAPKAETKSDAPPVASKTAVVTVPLNIYPPAGKTIHPCPGIGVVDAPDVLAPNETTTLYSIGNGDYIAA
jgi:hypothetical protein